jgi:predicted Rossmann fold nucleotide-binding protein DprA/Smf involved in DNA uptake
VTGGRTEPADGAVLDLISVVVATDMDAPADDEPLRRTPEHRKILARCQRQATVADIASETALPLGVVRVLLGDLILAGAVTVVRQRPRRAQPPGNDVLQEILNGLRAL